MNFVMRHFPAGGVVAAYEEAPGGGDPRSLASQCNRPAADPDNWLAGLRLHSGLDYLERHSQDVVTITHPAASGTTTDGAGGGSDQDGLTKGAANAASLAYGRSSTTHLLKTHGLGYRPIVVVLVGGKRLFNGQPVQTAVDGRARYVSVYVTTTEVRLHEWTAVSGSALAAVSIDYTVLVIRNPRAASGNALFSFDGGETRLGFDRFANSRSYLQVIAGGSPWTMSAGRQGDFSRDGAPRFCYPDGTHYDPVPTDMRGKFVVGWRDAETVRTYDPGYGSANMAYAGDFAGSPSIAIQTDPPAAEPGSRGFYLEPGRLRFANGGVDTARAGDGQLLMFLTTVHSFSPELAFPDLDKDESYIWTTNNRFNPLNIERTYRGEGCSCFITAVPQSYASEIVLMDAPAGADFFVGHMKLSRSAGPTKTWMERDLTMLPVADQYIPLFGAETILLEAEVGFVRGLHIYINAAHQLVLRMEQSVAIAINGYGTIKATPATNVTGGGGSVLENVTRGIPFFLRSTKSRGYTDTGQFSGTYVSFSRSGGNPCARDDTTNMSSTYQVTDLQVRFGKRSV